MRIKKQLLIFVIALTASHLVIAESNKHSYQVDFNDSLSQSEALENIQNQINNNSTHDELRVILFGKGYALSVDANAISNSNIQYGNTNNAVNEKMKSLENQGVQFIICKTPTTTKRHYSTKKTFSNVKDELQNLESQGYKCN